MSKQKIIYKWWILSVGVILGGLISSIPQSPLAKVLIFAGAIVIMIILVIWSGWLTKTPAWQKRQFAIFKSLHAIIESSKHPLYKLSPRKAKLAFGIIPVSLLVYFFAMAVLRLFEGSDEAFLAHEIYIADGFLIMILIWLVQGLYLAWATAYRKSSYVGGIFYAIAAIIFLTANQIEQSGILRFVQIYGVIAVAGLFVILGWSGFVIYKYVFPLTQYHKIKSWIDAGIIQVSYDRELTKQT